MSPQIGAAHAARHDLARAEARVVRRLDGVVEVSALTSHQLDEAVGERLGGEQGVRSRLGGQRLGEGMSDAAKGSREEVELFFATNALTFVVGWSWIVLSRDLSTLSAAGTSSPSRSLPSC